MDLLKRVLCTIVLVGIGFIIGRKTVEEKTVIKYVDLPPIQGEVKVPDLVPKWEGFRNPIKLIYIYKGQEEKGSPNTPKKSQMEGVLGGQKGGGYSGERKKGQCWTGIRPGNTLEHSSKIPKLANLTGKLQSNTTLSSILRTSISRSRTNQRNEVPEMVPFLRASANSFGQVGVGGGIYYRNFGVDISYMRDFELTRSGYEVGFSWKF